MATVPGKMIFTGEGLGGSNLCTEQTSGQSEKWLAMGSVAT